MLPMIKPMLAAPSTGTGSRRAIDLSTLVHGTHLFDLKLDGLRALAYWTGSDLMLINRSGRDITRLFPDIEALAPALGEWPCILDGEIVCDSGLFNDVATRGKQEKPHDIARNVASKPARFIAFDLLHLDGSDLRSHSYFDRRMMLDGMAVLWPKGTFTASMMSTDGLAMWSAVSELGLEGIIAKDKTSPYMEGKRSPAWLKFKTVRRITCVMTSYEKGEGARTHFGAGHLVLMDPAKAMAPTPVGKVGTGFSNAEIDQLKAEIDGGAYPVVEIEALNVGSGGQLRFPVFKGWRTDLSVLDCTLDQLDQLPRC